MPDSVEVVLPVELPQAVALTVEEGEAVTEGEALALPLAVPVGVYEEEDVKEGLGAALPEGPGEADPVEASVKAGLSVACPKSEGAPVGVPPPRAQGLPLPDPEAEALGEALGLSVALGESVVEGEALGLGDPEGEALGEGLAKGDSLPEAEAEGEGLPLELPLGEALVLMLPVAVPGGGGATSSPPSSSPIPTPAAPRLVGVGLFEVTELREGLEVFVAVLVEVRVWVVVGAPGAVTVGVGAEDADAREESLPMALPVGEEVAEVTSWSSTTSTRVTRGTETLMVAWEVTVVMVRAPGPRTRAVDRLPPGGIRQEALAAMVAITRGKVWLARLAAMASGGMVMAPRSSTRSERVGAEALRAVGHVELVALKAVAVMLLLLLLPPTSRRRRKGGAGAAAGSSASLAARAARPLVVVVVVVSQELAVFATLEGSTVWLALSVVRVPDTSTPPRGSPRTLEISQR